MKFRHIPGSNALFDFGSRNIQTYASEKPILDLREYLVGPLQASGVFFGISGMITRRFTLSMVGKWSGNKGTLDEDFRFHDGEIGHRCWSLKVNDNGTFSATADDVEGHAQGVQSGNTAVMSYRLNVLRKQRKITVHMEDWLYLLDDGTLINRARMTKFGLKVGEIVAFFYKYNLANNKSEKVDSG